MATTTKGCSMNPAGIRLGLREPQNRAPGRAEQDEGKQCRLVFGHEPRYTVAGSVPTPVTHKLRIV